MFLTFPILLFTLREPFNKTWSRLLMAKGLAWSWGETTGESVGPHCLRDSPRLRLQPVSSWCFFGVSWCFLVFIWCLVVFIWCSVGVYLVFRCCLCGVSWCFLGVYLVFLGVYSVFPCASWCLFGVFLVFRGVSWCVLVFMWCLVGVSLVFVCVALVFLGVSWCFWVFLSRLWCFLGFLMFLGVSLVFIGVSLVLNRALRLPPTSSHSFLLLSSTCFFLFPRREAVRRSIKFLLLAQIRELPCS